MTEEGITPAEAHEAMTAIMLQTGHVLEKILDYDYNGDKFVVEARAYEQDLQGGIVTGKLKQCIVRGETVAKVVAAARVLAGVKVLRHPQDLAKPPLQ